MAERGVKTDRRAVWTFVRKEGLSFKKSLLAGEQALWNGPPSTNPLQTEEGRAFFKLTCQCHRDFPQKVATQNSPVWRVLALSRWRDRRLRFLAAGRSVSGVDEWGWRERSA